MIVRSNVVYEECTIAGDTLPHGRLDIVAGNMDGCNGGKVAVEVMSQPSHYDVYSPVTVSAKTRDTVPTSPPNKSFCLLVVRINILTTKLFSIGSQVVFETLAFSNYKIQEGSKVIVHSCCFCRYMHK